MKSGWPVKAFELSGLGSAGASEGDCFKREREDLTAHAKNISIRTSDRGDTQRKLAETLRGKRHAEHDRGDDELIKSIFGLSRAGLFLGINGFLWGLGEYGLPGGKC